MASALFSRRKSSWSAATAPERTKSTTNCLTCGLIFRTATSFFRTSEKEIDPALDIRVVVLVEMQLGNMPEAQSAGQLMAQVVPGVLQGIQRLLLFPVCAPDYHLDG